MALSRYDWPGNVRELANEVQRALVLAEPGVEIGLSELSAKVTGAAPNGGGESVSRGALREAVEAVEREVIQRAYERFGGNKSQMAEVDPDFRTSS